MNKKFLIVLEVTWIITGVLCLIAGIRYASGPCNNKTFVFFLLAVVSFLFAWFRERERKK
jgi:hypothetical protein